MQALLENGGQPFANPLAIIAAQSAALHEGFRPGEAAPDIVFEKPAIEGERDPEVERGRIGCGIKPAGPEVAAAICDF